MRTPIKVLSGADRFGRSVHFLNGHFDLKVSAEDTGGAWCAFDTVRTKQGGPPVHVHLAQDEWFFVLEGSFRFRVGTEYFDTSPGDSIFGPRGVPHAFRNTTDTARLLLVFQPALSIEAFFSLQLLDPSSHAFADLSLAHGMEIVGPPLT